MNGFYEEEKANFSLKIEELKTTIQTLNDDNRQLLIDKININNEYADTIDDLNDIYEDSLRPDSSTQILNLG